MGLLTVAAVTVTERRSPLVFFRSVAWSVLALVAGLFVVVEAVSRTGLTTALAQALAAAPPKAAAWAAGAGLAAASNLANNLPVGLVAAATLAKAHVAPVVGDAALIGVDLGPNLSITGSLATLLWLIAVRREGENVGFRDFLKLGLVAMPPALILALGARLSGP
jgi:arsenical pump membrane protein